MHDTGEMHALLVSRFPALRHVPADYFVVGGAVRDLLIDQSPLDVDVTGAGAAAAADQFARAARGRLLELGRDTLRIWRVFAGGRIYDFAELHRGSIDSDLGRRDFTIDALAWRMDERQLIDRFGGLEDLRAGSIRMIAEENLVDDPLRMLKAVRMAARFGFTIGKETAQAIRRNVHLLPTVAPERITYELDGIVCSTRTREGFALMRSLGIDLFDGELAPTVDEGDPDVKLALALRKRAPDDIRRLSERWRWSRRRTDTIISLLRSRDSQAPLPVAIYDAGRILAPRVSQFLRALGHPGAGEYESTLEQSGDRIFATRALLGGEEISELAGIDAGPELGAIKRRLLEAQLLGEVRTREAAEQFVTGFKL